MIRAAIFFATLATLAAAAKPTLKDLNGLRDAVAEEFASVSRDHKEHEESLRLSCKWNEFVSPDETCDSCSILCSPDPATSQCGHYCPVFSAVMISRRDFAMSASDVTSDAPSSDPLSYYVILGLLALLYLLLIALVSRHIILRTSFVRSVKGIFGAGARGGGEDRIGRVIVEEESVGIRSSRNDLTEVGSPIQAQQIDDN